MQPQRLLERSKHHAHARHDEKLLALKHHVLRVHHLLELVLAQLVSPLALHLCARLSELQLLLCEPKKLFGEEFEQADDLARQSRHDAAAAQ